MSNNIKKNNSGILKIKGMFVLIMLVSIFAVGCSKQNNGLVNEQLKEEENLNASIRQQQEESGEDAAQENNSTEEIKSEPENINNTMDYTDKAATNNGGMYVSYNGYVYYRQYTADSYASEGLMGTYETIIGSKKNMIRMSEDGTTEIAFSDNGEGNIYIYKDRMYLVKSDEDYVTNVYAVDLDGSNEQILGKGWIKGIDEDTGTLVCVLANEKDTYQLHWIDGVTGVIKEYDLAVPCSEFLSLKDGVIYYSGEVEFESSQLGEIKLCCVNVDGTNEKLLADTKADLYEYGDRGTVVPCIQFVGNTIYFAYGAYGGTGNFYQGGKIAKVEKDGSEFAVLIGATEVEEDLVDEIFYVSSDNNEETLYYSQGTENKVGFVLNLITGEVEETDFPIYAEGKPFEYKGGFSIYLNASSKMTTWIPFVDYNYLELVEEADYYTVKDIELCDNWIYYRLEANKKDPEASIGWRDGFRRLKTKVIREKIDGETVEILFEY